MNVYMGASLHGNVETSITIVTSCVRAYVHGVLKCVCCALSSHRRTFITFALHYVHIIYGHITCGWYCDRIVNFVQHQVWEAKGNYMVFSITKENIEFETLKMPKGLLDFIKNR